MSRDKINFGETLLLMGSRYKTMLVVSVDLIKPALFGFKVDYLSAAEVIEKS
jgi:hypothetical protein